MTAHIQYAHNGEVSIGYETFGDLATGEPLLLIMGLDFQMVYWPDRFIERLVERGFAVVRFDNRDTGLSTKFTSPGRQSPWKALRGKTKPAYSGLDMLDDTLAVMDAVGWQSAHVMGGSMGAGLAQGLAAIHPDRIRTLISLSGLPVDSSPLKTLTYLKFRIFLKIGRIKPGGTREEQIETLVRLSRVMASPAYPFAEDWATQAATISHDRSPRDPLSTQRQLAAGRAQKLPPLSQITAPTLVISGEDDPLLKLKGGRDTAHRIPGARFVSYPGMGHNLPEELWPQIVDEISTLAEHSTHPVNPPVSE
jgi:pimeloyl-ACP methyl ester carboxylesterase